LIPRFIVRTQHLLSDQPTVWRAGEVLNVEGCRVLIRGDLRTSRVFIQVQGPTARQRRQALAVVRSHFHAIHLTYGDLGAQARVPLPNDPLAPPVDYELLLTLESEGVREQRFEKVAAPYNVSDLLNGVDERCFHVFLCHNTRDAALVDELAGFLRRHHVRCWLDRDNLTPGELWQREIGVAIRNCRTIAVLVGPEFVGPVQQEEMFVGLDYSARGNKRTIPVLLPGTTKALVQAAGLEFLANRTWVDFSDGFSDQQVERLARAILDA
jgi:hypothetical protein